MIVILNSTCLIFLEDWVSGNRSQVVVWNVTADSDVVYLTAQLQSPAVLNEIKTLPEWGTLYHAMKSVSEGSMIRFFCS